MEVGTQPQSNLRAAGTSLNITGPGSVEISTTRFGKLEVKRDRILTFDRGLQGFPENIHFVLLDPSSESNFFWLQSITDPKFALVVTDPDIFVVGYKVPIRKDELARIGLEEGQLSDSQIFVTVRKVDNELRGDLLGPLVVNTLTRKGEQLILTDQRWSSQQLLCKIGQAAQVPARTLPNPQLNDDNLS